MKIKSRADLEIVLRHTPPGRPFLVGGVPVERLMHLYRIDGAKELYGLESALDALMPHMTTTEDKRDDVPDRPIFPKEVRAISTHFPWTWLIVNGFKEEEFRSRATNFRGWALQHASLSEASDDVIVDYRIPKRDIVRQAILGAARIVDCYPDDNGGWAYALEDAVRFDQPILNVPGDRIVFWGADTTVRIKAFNRAWMKLKEMGAVK